MLIEIFNKLNNYQSNYVNVIDVIMFAVMQMKS